MESKEKKNNRISADNYRINLKQVMPYILDTPYKDIINGEIKPSLAYKELRCTTEERLEKLRNPQRKFKLVSKRDAFKRIPEAVIFQNFNKGVPYVVPVEITNQRAVPLNIMIHFENSRHFTATIENSKTRIAPGMSIIIRITFLPTERFLDYEHKIKVTSNYECFVIPIYALGPRPLCNMPDRVVLPPTVVRVPTEKVMIVKNLSDVLLSYVALTDKPFTNPLTRATVPPHGIFEKVISCLPLKAGMIRGNMKCYFRNQLCLTVKLECEVKTVRLNLDTRLVIFEDTYLGLCSRKIFRVRNDSPYTLQFIWKEFDAKKESEEMNKVFNLIEEMRAFEEKRCQKLEYLDILHQRQHSDIYRRIYEDEKKELAAKEDMFIFRSDFADIIPKVGKVLPHSEFEFTVIFYPKEAKYYSCVAYLDIDGVEERIRVDLQGDGIGPRMALNVLSIDANQIYLTDKHQYEIAVFNEGIIPGTVSYIEKESNFGGTISCIPKTFKVNANEKRAFILVFSSTVQGDFLETIDFIIQESGEKLQCLLSGKVICPLLKCLPNNLEFGEVAIGVVHERTIDLINESRVDICFDIEISYAPSDVIYLFEVSPTDGLVKPQSSTPVKVTIFCETNCTASGVISVIMWKSHQYTATIPFHCTCSCPRVTCPPKIMIKFCFLNCKYQRSFKITNETDIAGLMEYVPEEGKEQAILCELDDTKFYIPPKGTIDVPITVTVTELGPQELPLVFMFGKDIKQKLSSIICNGQGPVITYYPDEINFGKVNVLAKYEQYLSLINDSPIPAFIKIYCKNNSPFSVEEGNIRLEGEDTKKIAVSLFMKDPKKTKDTVFVEIHQGDVLTVKVSGEGVGTSIVCEPELLDHNLGTVLTYKLFCEEIKVTNKGSVHHKLLFSKRSDLKAFTEEGESDIPGVFSMEPCLFDLDSNQEQIMKLIGKCRNPKRVEEKFYCYAIIGSIKGIKTLNEMIISADFVDPSIQFSKTEMHFNINVLDGEQTGMTKDELRFRNKTGIDIDVSITIDNSFTICNYGKKTNKITKSIKNLIETVTDVEYCPNIKQKRRYKQKGTLVFEYENHYKLDVISLHGEVMFPTVNLYPDSLDFQCIPLGSSSYKLVVIKNVSCLTANFKWHWSENIFSAKKIKPDEPGDEMCFNFNTEENLRTKPWFYIENKICDIVPIEDVERCSQITEPSLLYQAFHSSEMYKEEMKEILFPLLSSVEVEESNLFDMSFKNCNSHDITKWLSIEPSEGILEPSEYTIVTVGFNPPPNTEVSAGAICKVYGGEEEILNITGKSSKLSYILDKTVIDYGNQIFCEICVQELNLINDGLCCIEFKASGDDLCSFEWDLFNVEPKTGTISAGETITFTVSYFPGIPGYFSKKFVLELGYLEQVTIDVYGYAVMCQIYLHAPRALNIDDSDYYKAIAWITPEYLERVPQDSNNPVEDELVDSADFLYNNNWTVVSYNDTYPSLMDIDMAAERIITYNFVSKNKRILRAHTFLRKIPCIPDLTPPPYLIDFGHVIRDLPVCYTVTLYNYGPIRTDVKLVMDNKSSLLESEFVIEYKDTMLNPGDSVALYVIFSPSRRKNPVVDKEVNNVFRLRVRHGPTITVKLKAKVTLPTISVKYEEIYFEKVNCGTALRKTVLLTNNGNVESKWFLSFPKSQKTNALSGFYVIPKKGTLSVGQSTLLHVYFIPSDAETYRRVLKIEVEKSDNFLSISLFGEGVNPKLSIVPERLEFSSTLNYFSRTLKFYVENVSDLPMEFYYPTFTDDVQHEQMLTDTFLSAKSLNYVLIPYRHAGDTLPTHFKNEYDNLLCRLRKKMLSMKESEVATTDSPYPEAQASRVTLVLSYEDPLVKYSKEELHKILKEYIDMGEFQEDVEASSICHLDESPQTFEIIEPDVSPETDQYEVNGGLIIVHGAPYTEYYKAANAISKTLPFPIYSIDRLIIEALVEQTHPCSQDILSVIDEQYYEITSSNSTDMEDNMYDKILEKINTILTTKPKKPKKGSLIDKGSRGSSEKSQNKAKSGTTDCFLNILPENLVDLLKMKLCKFPFLIIESLVSIFCPKENLALYSILKAAGPLKYIQIILFSYTTSDFIKSEQNKDEEIDDTKIVKDIKKQEVSDKISKKSAVSDKKSKASEMKKKLPPVPKPLKDQLEKYESLQREIVHVAQNWDKISGVLKKPFIDKIPKSGRKDINTKESVKTLKSSARKVSDTNIDDSKSEDIGCYFWLILNSHEDRPVDFCSMIRNSIETFADLNEILQSIDESTRQVLEETDTLFSVISKYKSKDNVLSDIFNIKNCKSRDSIDSTKGRSKSASASGLGELKPKRRRGSRRSSVSAKSIDLYREGVKEAKVDKKDKVDREEFTTRMILQPGERTIYEVTFNPSKVGNFKHNYVLRTLNNNNLYQISCIGLCEVPNIDFRPQVMFPKVLDDIKEKAAYDHFVFIKNQNVLDFGNTIVGANLEKCQTYSCKMVLRNPLSTEADVTVSFNNDFFFADLTSVTIPPKDKRNMKVSIKPNKIGSVTSNLYISIGNNPVVREFALVCTACKLEFNIAPKTIAFDKVPLTYHAKRVVKLTNSSPINLRWQMDEYKWAADILYIPEVSGLIGIFSVSEVAFRFHPKEEISFPKKQVLIKIFDVNSENIEPFHVETISIHGDSVEYALEFDKLIDYGEIKGGIEHKLNFNITNKSKCEIAIKYNYNAYRVQPLKSEQLIVATYSD